MAAKTLEEALYCANIDIEIKKALCVGPAYELAERIQRAEMIIISNLKDQLRDYFAHQAMFVEGKASFGKGTGSAKELFDHVFRDISAIKGENHG